MNTRKCPIVVVRCFAPLYKNGLVLISYKGIEVLPAKNLRYNVTCCVCRETSNSICCEDGTLCEIKYLNTS